MKFKGMCVTASPPPPPPSTCGSAMDPLSSFGCSCGSSPCPTVTIEELFAAVIKNIVRGNIAWFLLGAGKIFMRTVTFDSVLFCGDLISWVPRHGLGRVSHPGHMMVSARLVPEGAVKDNHGAFHACAAFERCR